MTEIINNIKIVLKTLNDRESAATEISKYAEVLSEEAAIELMRAFIERLKVDQILRSKQDQLKQRLMEVGGRKE